MKKALHTFITQSSNLNKIMFLLIALSIVQIGKGQVISNYPFTTNTTSTLEDLTAGATSLMTGLNDDAATGITSIGFDFYFGGVRYTSFSANSNGQLKLHISTDLSAISASGITTYTVNKAYLFPMSGDNELNGGMKYKVIGTAPNRKLVVEWTQFYAFYTNITNAGNMQVWLEESTGKISYVYGEIYNSSSGTISRGIALSFSNTATTARYVTVAATPTSTASATITTNTFTAGSGTTTGSPLIANLGTSTANARRAYIFTPTATTTPTNLTFTSIAQSSYTLNWTDNASDELGYVIFSSSDGTNYTYLTTTAANATSQGITSMSANTTYYWKVYALRESLGTALTGSQATASCPTYSGTMTVGPSAATFPNLTTAINTLSACGYTGNIILELQSTYVSTGETFPITFPTTLGTSASKTITIRPASGATGRSITSANTTGTINFNGASYITFDGRPGGSGSKDLVIANTNVGTSYAVQLINDANNNAFNYCKINSVNNNISSGTVVFSNTTGSNGNDNNSIDNCDIYDGSTTPYNAIYANGSASPKDNNNNIISNCNIYNFYASTNTSSGIYLTTGNTDWSITNNNFYQTSSRTGNASYNYGIYISNTSGNNFSITGNNIGGGAINCGGSAWTYTLSGATRFAPIYLSVGTTTASSVQNNTIANISLSSTSGATGIPGVFSGICLFAGNANIGTVTGNIIGSSSGTGSIQATTSTSGGISMGIGSSSTGTLSISKNTIGSITVMGSAATVSHSFNGIWNYGAATSVTIDGNTIGGTTTNSINASTASTNATAQIITGIYSNAGATTVTISNNTVANINNAYVPSVAYATNSVLRGIYADFGSNTITGNTIYNLSTAANATGTTYKASVLGIGFNTTSTDVSRNTIYGLKNSHASGAVLITGICYGFNSTGVVARNQIYNFGASSTSAVIKGIESVVGTVTFKNNMIRLGYDELGANLTTACSINGFYEAIGATNNYYFNTVNIGGTGVATTATATYAMNSLGTNTRVLQNNIFVNNRSNSTTGGKHYAIKVAGAAANPTGLTINYNDYIANGTGGTFGFFNSLDVANIGAWRTAVGQDGNSLNSDPVFINATSATPDLHIHATNPSPIEAAGIDIPSITDDFDGQTRSGLSPVDIGADAGNFASLDLSAPTISYIALSNTSSLTNRVLTATITDATGVATSGTGLPMLYWKINSGSYTGVQGVSIGSNQYTFTFGSGVAITNTVSYYIVAQDNTPAKNITAYPTTGASGYTTDAPACSTAPTTPSTYSILNSFSGTISVGTGQTYTSLTNASGLFAAINAGIVTGNTTVNIVSNITETGANALNQWTEEGAGSYSLTIQSDGSSRVLSGLSTTYLIPINGADRVIFDGGASKLLTFRNYNSVPASTGIVIGFYNGSTLDTLRNCIIESNGSSTTTGAVTIGTGTNSVTISTNDIRDNRGGTNNGSENIGIYSSTPTNTLTITNNNIYNWKASSGTSYGISLSSVADGCIITGNSFYMESGFTSAFGQTAISVLTGNNHTINNNYIGGQAASCGGSAWANSGAVAFKGISVGGSTVTPNSIQGNVIQNISLTSTGASSFVGITVASGSNNIGTVTQNLIGHATTDGSISIAGTGTVTGVNFVSGNLNNTLIANIKQTATGPGKFVGILFVPSNSTSKISKNMIYSVGPTSSSTGTADVDGIYTGGLAAATAGWTISNNMISLGYGITNNHIYKGIDDWGVTGNNFYLYYNTIRIAGTANGTSTTYAYLKRDVTNETHNNNIYVNVRTGSTGKHYAIANTSTASGTFIANRNDYYVAGSVLGILSATDAADIAAWKTATSQDANSVSIAPAFTSTTDLHLSISSNLDLDNLGTPVSETTDIDGETRSVTTPDMGADEFSVEMCSTENGGTANATVTSICTSGSATLSSTGYSTGAGSTYEWEKSTDNFATAAVSMGSATSTYATMSTGTISTTTYYRLKVICSAGTPAYSSVVTIDVYTSPTLSLTSNTSVCAGSGIELTVSGADTYAWSPAGTLSAASGSTVTATPASTTTYYVTGTDSHSCTSTASVTITVNPVPSAVTVSQSPTAVCAGAVATLTTSGGIVTGATIASELFNGATSSFLTGFTTGTPTATQNTTYYSEGTSSYLFNTASNSADVNFTLTNAVNLSSYTSATLTFSHICATEAAYDYGYIQYSTNNGSTWTSFPTTSYTGTATLKNSVVSFDKSSYSDWGTQFSGAASTPGTSPAASLWKTETITIPVVALSSTQFKIRFRYTTDSGTSYYGWLIDNVNITGTWPAPITWSPTTDLYTNAGATTPYSGESATVVYAKNNTSTSYTATATYGSCTATKNINTSINALPTLSTSDATICNGNSTPLSVSGASSYSWSPATGLSATNVSSVTANPSSTQVYTITGTDGNNCTNTTTSTVTVNPVINITAQPNNVVALQNADALFSVTATGVGLGYQWQVNTGSGFGDILGANSASYTETAVTSGMSGYSYQCIVTGTACSSVTSDVATLTISSTAITSQPASTSICSNQSANFTISTSGTTPTYQWQISTNGGSSWSDISGEITTDLTVSGLTSANSLTKYRCQLNGGAINSDPATLTIYDVVSIGTQPTDQSTCSNSASVAFSASATGSNLTYQWQVSTNGGVDWASASGSSTSDTYTITSPSVSLNQYKYRVIVSGTSPCSPVTSDPVTLTVIGVSTVSSLSGTDACISTPFDLTVSPTSGSPSLSYSWASTAGSGAATPVTTNPATITPTIAGSYTYTLTATGGGCTLTDSKNITVNSLPSITTYTAAPATVCSGATIILSATSVSSSASTAAVGSGATTSSTYSNPFYSLWSNTHNQYLIKASELTTSNIVAGNITSLGINITSGTMAMKDFSIKIGHTSATDMSSFVSNSGFTTVYSTTSITPVVGLNTITFSSPFTWDGTSNIVIEICHGNSSSSATMSSTVNVDNTSYVSTIHTHISSASAGSTTCADQSSSLTTYSVRPKFTFGGQVGTNITASYNWSWNSTPAVNAATGTTTVTNTSGSATTPTFTVTATNATTGCINTATTSAVTVNTSTVAPTANHSSQCGVQTPTCSVTGTGNVGNTYKWYTVAVGGTALAGQTASTLSSYPVASTTTFYVSEVTPDGCESPRVAVTVTVTSAPTITLSATNTTVCGGTTTTLSASSSNPDYTYTWSNSLGTGSSVIATPVAATTYYVTASDNSGNANNGCVVTDNIAIAFTPASVGGTATATVSTMCQTGSSSLTVAGYTGSIQWEQSADNSTWGNVSSGGTAATYATGTITQTTYYRAKITNSSCTAAYSNVLTITVNNPQVLTTTPNSRCGTGTVTIGATASDGATLNWYAAAAGGSSLGTGTSFTTPSISANTNYYVSAEIGSNATSAIGNGVSLTGATAQPTAFCNRFSSYHHQYIYTASELTTAGFSAGYIQSMGYNINSLGDASTNANYTVKIGNTVLTSYTDFVNTGLSTVYGPSTYTHTSSGLQTITFATPFYWDGSSNILVDVSMSGANSTNNSTTYYTTTGSAMGGYSLSGGATATTTTSRLNTTFTIQSCSSSRTAVTATVNSVPTATFTASPSATSCSNTAVTYTTQSGQSNYTWSVPGVAETDYHITAGGISATDNSVSLTWLTAGSKTVTVNYTNSNGCYSASVATNTITAYVTPVPSFTVEPSANVCKNNDVTYTTQASFSNYIWTVDGVAETDYHIVSGGVGTGSNTLTLRWLTTGSKTVTVNYSSGVCQGVSAASNTTTSNESPVPTFTASSASSVCTSSDITFTTQGSKSAYNWVIPGTVDVDYTITAGGISATDNTVTLRWITTGSKVVTVNYSEFGCSGGDAATSSATVYSFPSPTFTTSPGASVCANSNVTYTTQTLQSNYVWSVPGTVDVDYTIISGNLGTTSNTVTLSWITAGSKEVTVNYDNMCGSGGVAASNTTTVNARPVPTFTSAPGANVCLNTDITYTTQAGQSSYVWSVPGTVDVNYSITSGGISATDNTVTLKWLTTGSKNVTVNYTDGNSCTGASTASNTTTVDALVTATFTATPSTNICANTDVTYTTQSGSGENNYTWSVPGTQDVDYSITSGGIGTGSSTVTLKWLTAGSKTVTVSYLTTNSCLSTTASNTTSVSSLSGTVTVGSGGTYTTLTGANGLFSVINSCGLAGNLTANIISDITETGANALNQWSGSWTLKIQPNGGVARTLTGSVAAPLIDLNGADNVTIDGLNTGGNSLTISNTNTAGTAGTSTIRFIADATNNTITNCTILGSSTATTLGTILFSTGTTSGNTGNIISNNNVSAAGSNLPINAIYSVGSSPTIFNSGSITGNNISDYFSAASVSVGINISATGNSAWTISNNRLFQTASRIHTAGTTHNAIYVGSGSGYIINNNIIGFANSSGTGTTNIIGNSVALTGTFPSAFTTTGTANATRYIAISCAFTAAGTVSEIQGNTVSGIALYTSNGTATGYGALCGIQVTSGNANIGTTSGNIIGASTGTNSLYLASIATATLSGIYCTTANTITIQNNTIGAIDVSGTTATKAGSFKGIDIAGTGTYTVSSNYIGNTTANNIRTGYLLTSTNLSNVATTPTTATGVSDVTGILCSTTGATVNISSNKIQGIQISGSATTFNGISNTGAQTTSLTVDGNSLGTTTGLVNYAFANSGALVGISLSGSGTTTAHTISNNDFRGITNSVAASQAHTYINLTGATAASDVATIAGNTFTNLNVNTSGNITFISHSYAVAATGTQTINNNSIVTAFNKGTAGGTITLATSGGTSLAGAVINHYNNNFSNITVTGATTIAGWFSTDGGAANKNYYSNTFNNWTGGSSAITAMNINYGGGNSGNGNYIYNNTITNITGTGAITGLTFGTTSGTLFTVTENTITGLSSTTTGGAVSGIVVGGTTANVFSNTINTLSSASTTATTVAITSSASTANIYSNAINTLSCVGTTSGVTNGIMITAASTVANVYKNKIYDLTTSGAFTTTPGVNGILLSAGLAVNVSNNLIGDLKAPTANSTDAIRGISITSTTVTTNYNVYYNTIYLTATSSGTNFGVTGLYHAASVTATTATLGLRNNVIVNNSTASGTGLVVAFRRSAGGANTLANYTSTSNNNLFYAGTPSATNLIYSDGTSTAQTIAQFSAGAFTAGTITPRDAADVTENPTWLSTTGSSSNYLHVDPTTLTVIESGGANIATYTFDYDGDVRQGNSGYPSQVNEGGTAPDLGADEFDGKPAYTCAAPTPGNTVASTTTLCGGQSVNLSLQNATSGTGVTYQWKSSTDGITYNDVNGATSSTLTNTPPVSTHYECVVTCANGPSSATSTPIQVTYPNSVTSTTPATRCGTGTVNLGATASGGTLNWYAAASGGTALGTGASFTTPSINTSTTYYVGAETSNSSSGDASIGTSSTYTTGYPNLVANYWFQVWQQMIYTAAELQAQGMVAGNITSLKFNVYSNNTSTLANDFRINMGSTSNTSFASAAFVNTGLTQVYGPTTATGSTGWITYNLTTPYYWDGTSNIIIDIRETEANSTSYAQTYYTTSSDNVMVYGYASGSSNSNFYTSPTNVTLLKKKYNVKFTGQIGSICSSPRTAVVATVNATPTAGTIATAQTICSESTPAAFTSSLDGTGTGTVEYEWQTNASGSYVTIGSEIANTYAPPALTATTSYQRRTVATNGGATCYSAFSTPVQITVKAPPTAPTAIIGTNLICSGAQVTLTASGGNNGDGAVYEWGTGSIGNNIIIGETNINVTTSPLTSNTTYWVRRTGTTPCSANTAGATQLITVNTPSNISGLTTGDYVWAGYNNTNWNTLQNWLVYDSEAIPVYSIPATVPTLSNKVFIINDDLACGFASSASVSTGTANCNNITIDAGRTLILNDGETLNVSGNWSNNGTFTAGTNSTVAFSGTSQQTVVTNGSVFNKLTVNNSNGLLLSSNLNVTNTLTMTTGNIIMGSYTLELGQNASNPGTLNYVSGSVHGKMKRWYAESTNSGNSGLFPIGVGSDYRPLLVEFTDAPVGGGNLSVQFNEVAMGWQNSGNSPTISAINGCSAFLVTSYSSVGYWEVNPTGAGMSNAAYNITLVGGGFTGVNTLCKTTAVKRVGSGLWTTSGTHVPPTGTLTSPIVQRIGAMGWSNWGIAGGGDNLLPIELLSFNAECSKTAVNISWSTASETNNKSFTVEKSYNGNQWVSVAELLGAGNSTHLINYHYMDANSAGITYYRLKQTDFDGAYTYSEPISVNCESSNNNQVIVYPNPFKNSISINGLQEVASTFEITDVMGKIVYKDFRVASFTESINLGSLTPGLYTLIIIDKNGNSRQFKIVKN